MDRRYPEKRKQAAALLRKVEENGTGVISTQVIQETFVAGTTKLGIPALQMKDAISKLNSLEIVNIDFALIQEAMDCHMLSRISFWDALIIVSAARARCSELCTEDLQNGQVIRGVKIRNPFSHD